MMKQVDMTKLLWHNNAHLMIFCFQFKLANCLINTFDNESRHGWLAKTLWPMKSSQKKFDSMLFYSQALCSLLRRDASINFKAKGNSLVSVLACNLLMAAYEEDENWPEIFVKVRTTQTLKTQVPFVEQFLFVAIWNVISGVHWGLSWGKNLGGQFSLQELCWQHPNCLWDKDAS